MLRGSYTQDDINELKGIFLKRAMAVDPDGTAALALSGGIDSVGVLFAQMELGRKPHCYTFYMDAYESEDIRASRNLANKFGLSLTEVVLPTDVDSMYNDVRRVIPHLCKIKKTNVECTIPWLYLLPVIEEDTILVGLGGDDYCCNDRKSNVLRAKVGEEGMLEHRLHKFDDTDNADRCTFELARKFGKEVIDFYDFHEGIDWFMQFKLSAINSPFQKAPLVLCWKSWYDKGNFYKKHSDYQANSRLRDFYGTLLQSGYNKAGHKSVIGLYNQIARELGVL